MKFYEHPEIEDTHAFLSPSQPHWLNYDEEKLIDKAKSHNSKMMGTRLHSWACEAILLGRRQPKNKDTLNMYINDAIRYRMTPEVGLYYSKWCFGHADTASFHKRFLRIHDYKSGVTKVKMTQLEVYAGLFFLEYEIDPMDISGMELRIYQMNEVLCHEPNVIDIQDIMKNIIDKTERLEKLNRLEG